MTDTHGRPTVYLHIGAMKTGTTFLQQLMFANKQQLADAGLTVPGRLWLAQVRGVQEVLRLERRDPHLQALAKGTWPSLVDEAMAAPGHASVISMEFLSLARRRGTARVLDSLSEADVHVILTVREMTSALPALWQTLVHNGMTFGWEDFLASVEDWKPRTHAIPGRRRPVDHFRRSQDIPGILDRWTAGLPPSSVHVVTVPPAGSTPGLLWERFAQVVGVDAAVATEWPQHTNASIGLASTELVRHLNARLPRLSQSEYSRIVKRLALEVLETRAAVEGRATLTRSGYEAALRWNATVRADLVDRGAHVVGSLDDLPTTADPKVLASLSDSAAQTTTDELLDAAVAAAQGLDVMANKLTKRLQRRGVDAPDRSNEDSGAQRREAWASSDDPVGAATATLAEQVTEAAMLLRQVRALPERDGRTA